MFDVIGPVLTVEFIKPPEMRERRFTHFTSALYALDVKFQQANRPGGTFLDAKRYFSGKHSQYGFKIEAAVNSEGKCVYLSSHYAGSESDLSICRDNIEKHKKFLKKPIQPGGQYERDYEEGSGLFPAMWAMLVDKGYQGIQEDLRSIQPKKIPRNGSLSSDDITRNNRVSSDRVIVENYFGRMCMLWEIMSKKYVWDEGKFDQLSRLCCALTNFQVSLHPLRAEDGGYYKRVLAQYASDANQRRKRRAESQRESAKRRMDNLQTARSLAFEVRAPSSAGSNSSNRRNAAGSPRRFDEVSIRRSIYYDEESQDF